MKLQDITSGAVTGEVSLPNGLLWKDEFGWTPVASSVSYSLTGALIMEAGVRQKGRPITLEPPDESMAWVTREAVAQLRSWAGTADRKMKLVLEYPDDSREFTVMFRHYDGAIEANPVKGFPQHGAGDWFHLTIRLIEV